jgi:hypothetical protein
MTDLLPIEQSPSELADAHSPQRLRRILAVREGWLERFRAMRFPQFLIDRQRQLVAMARLAIALKQQIG